MKEAKAQKVLNPKDYYDAYGRNQSSIFESNHNDFVFSLTNVFLCAVLSIFHEMDPNMTGAIEFEQLIKPKFHQWMDFLRAVSTKGAREREFLRRLRSGGSHSIFISPFLSLSLSLSSLYLSLFTYFRS
jgi:hypothetical protein